MNYSDRLKGRVLEFGGCPECLGNDGFLNLGSAQWFKCDRHRLAWCAGSNILSSWRDENETNWKKNLEFLTRNGYRTINNPIFFETNDEL